MKTATTILIFCVAGLLSLGMVMLYSSSMGSAGAVSAKSHDLLMQLLWCAVGLVSCGVAACVDYHLLRKLAWPLFGVALVVLVAVLMPHIGHKVNGARRWFQLGSRIQVQPSELGKLALIIAVAWYGDRYQRQMHTWKRGIAVPCVFIGVILGLIFVEPDRGTTLLLAGVTGMMLLVAGISLKFAVPPVLAGIAGLGISLLHDPMRTKRIFAWLYLDEYKTGIGYQAYQSQLALGSGGWTGLGLGNSREKLGFLPEYNTDFIFSIIGEELGLIATLLVVLAFVLLVICGIYIASRSGDTFGLLLGSGLTFLIGLQAFINIGVVTSALPNKGLPLPFISRGGSNLLMMLTCVGVLISIARHARVAVASPAHSLEPGGLPAPQAS